MITAVVGRQDAAIGRHSDGGVADGDSSVGVHGGVAQSGTLTQNIGQLYIVDPHRALQDNVFKLVRNTACAVQRHIALFSVNHPVVTEVAEPATRLQLQIEITQRQQLFRRGVTHSPGTDQCLQVILRDREVTQVDIQLTVVEILEVRYCPYGIDSCVRAIPQLQTAQGGLRQLPFGIDCEGEGFVEMSKAGGEDGDIPGVGQLAHRPEGERFCLPVEKRFGHLYISVVKPDGDPVASYLCSFGLSSGSQFVKHQPCILLMEAQQTDIRFHILHTEEICLSPEVEVVYLHVVHIELPRCLRGREDIVAERAVLEYHIMRRDAPLALFHHCRILLPGKGIDDKSEVEGIVG